jgi:hypothetical protein
VDALPFPKVKPKVWKARACDDIEDPKIATAFLFYGNSLMDAASRCRSSDAFKLFARDHPNADLVSIEFIGEMT